MGFFNITQKKDSTQIYVEVFKGNLEQDAIVDRVKKEFSENENLKEAAFVVEGADEKLMTKTKELLTFEINYSEDFKLSYLAFITKNNKVFKLVTIITEGLEENFEKLLENNKFILRITK